MMARWLLCLVLLFLAQSFILLPSVTAEKTVAQRYKDLISWATKNGAKINVELREVGPNNWATFATKNLEKDELIVDLPEKLVVNSSYAIQYGPTPNRKNFTFPFEPITTALMLWRATNAGFYDPYIRSLPISLSHMPITWDDKQLDLLNGTSVYEISKNARYTHSVNYNNFLNYYYEEVKAGTARIIPEHALTLENYMVCYGYVSSRAWGSPSDRPERGSILVPIVDMLNHNSSWNYGVTTPTGFSINSAFPVTKGQEVFLSYGVKSPGEYLIGYGFIPDTQPDPYIPLRITRNSDPSNLIVEFSKKFGIYAEIVNIGANDLPIQTMAVLRASMITQPDLDLLWSIIQGKGISIENELHVIRGLHQTLTIYVDRLSSTTDEDDQRLLAASDISQQDQLAITLRRIERRIVHSQRKKLAKLWDNILLSGQYFGGGSVE